MTVIRVDTDHDNLTVTVISDFDAPVERVWELWTDPRKLDRWWGPPSYPATFETHDLVPGGEVRYFMTSPDGKQHAGMWRVTAVDPPVWLQFDDVFSGADGEPITDLPVARVSIRLYERDGGTRMVMRSKFESREDLERWLSTGTREGQEQAIAQMDELLRP
jgi:uncharacterized protein YndB with AHSA1/START domain